jgi:GntP family gluconate:H+ symporter
MFTLSPLVILLVGIATVILLILALRLNAFLALIAAALVVSLLSPGEVGVKVTRVATAFGEVTGKIGIVIALAAVIGKCLMDSGAADRIVRAFLRVLGEKRMSWALMGSGFVLGIPVFFDTVFYLLIPLARSFGRRTPQRYMLAVAAIAAGGAVTHTMVPPTPGPLFLAERLGIDLGVMMLVGTAVGLPTAIVGLCFCNLLNRLVPAPVRPLPGEEDSPPLDDPQLPPLWLSLLPVVLPVLLISAHTVAQALSKGGASAAVQQSAARVIPWTSLLGDPNLAMLIAAAIALGTLKMWRRLSFTELGAATESALMSGGVIILITAGGGAFGAMLREAGVQKAVEGLLGTGQSGGMTGVAILLAAFAVSSLLKFAQGSSTVAMITTVGMFAAMQIAPETLGCHLVYLALAISSGSLVGSWMNDSGFWIFAKMGGLTEVETLKTWSTLLVCLGVSGLGFTLVASRLVPLV